MRIFENINYEFIGRRKMGYVISGVLILVSLVSFAINGLELGIDFKGGREFVVETTSPLDVTTVRTALTDVLEFAPEVKTYQYNGAQQLLVRTVVDGDADVLRNQIIDTIGRTFPEVEPKIEKTYVVSANFAEDMKRGSIYSIIGSLLVIFVYILIRFEWRFGVGAVAALFHDVIITLGVFSLMQNILGFSLQIDQTIIAAFLTIVGYSLNDTVVVFDRIREYTGLFKSENYENVLNKSINNTLSRTVVTSGTTLLVVTVLFIFGGEVLRGFAFALIIGILIGTYSSVFVASPVVLELRLRAAGKRK
ncbi:MAG: protein translocase subunit SecF [Bacteroidetes Order II. Incertae sedis bacterium]|jgi:preprotein translocase subunit SecF|nr:protein translocase subunit SecF [Bacteroidetes Order II. bacterium]MDG1753762.1 protein translocase subunit SecF [Rhodothermales bacterium]MBT4053134.1 protein translocase subunit SecF [Bacteroidetes Order II. bacterium]MBT4602388.1 protein translocase subunit SecF [Bacteroidetes Order II. bacterium]MBT5250367.1 protein translocase subunit SecF [Bacteroidetes Order II. bacterium]